MSETLLSVGIDIGTTTTHLIISSVTINVEGGFGTVPRAVISDKKILYKSPVYFTPLDENSNIDLNGVCEIINSEYDKAGVTKNDLKSGAVIITGESSRKNNAKRVLHEVCENSGDFVAAQAGAELESFLAGKGAGADKISEETGKVTANVDIGGGTTNISVFVNGEIVDDCCLNVGGRLVRYKNGETIVSDTIKPFFEKCSGVSDFCNKASDVVYGALLCENIKTDSTLVTNHLLKGGYIPEIVVFSGGVGECINNMPCDNPFNDIGCMLAQSIKDKFKNGPFEIRAVSNPIRATVIGAGNFSLEISGSTICYSDTVKFPLKNLECIKNLSDITDDYCALCPQSVKSPSFEFVNKLARDIAAACCGLIKKHIPVVVITKYDFSKALGICLENYLPPGYPYICADGIDCKKGDFIDIGEPVAAGKAVPVIVKTLVFGG